MCLEEEGKTKEIDDEFALGTTHKNFDERKEGAESEEAEDESECEESEEEVEHEESEEKHENKKEDLLCGLFDGQFLIAVVLKALDSELFKLACCSNAVLELRCCEVTQVK